VLNGLTFFAVSITVAALRGGLRGTRRGAPAANATGLEVSDQPAGTKLGYRSLLQRRDLSLYILVCLSLALLVQATATLFVVRANVLGLGDGGVGVFYMAVAIGSVTGSVIAGARAQHAAPLYPAAIAMCICAIALGVFGAGGSVVIALAALVIAGFATDFYEVIGLTHFQGSVPDAVYGRFFSVFLMGLSAGHLVGALAGPALEQALGLETALIILAAPALALALLLMAKAKMWISAGPAP
jgi:hypothetical protein